MYLLASVIQTANAAPVLYESAARPPPPFRLYQGIYVCQMFCVTILLLSIVIYVAMEAFPIS